MEGIGQQKQSEFYLFNFHQVAQITCNYTCTEATGTSEEEIRYFLLGNRKIRRDKLS